MIDINRLIGEIAEQQQVYILYNVSFVYSICTDMYLVSSCECTCFCHCEKMFPILIMLLSRDNILCVYIYNEIIEGMQTAER